MACLPLKQKNYNHKYSNIEVALFTLAVYATCSLISRVLHFKKTSLLPHFTSAAKEVGYLLQSCFPSKIISAKMNMLCRMLAM